MSIGIIILGVISSIGLFMSGCSGLVTISVFDAAGTSVGTDVVSDSEYEKFVGGTVIAMIASVVVIVGAALPFALRKTCFIALVAGSLLAWWAFATDASTLFAIIYFGSAVLASISALLAGLSVRTKR